MLKNLKESQGEGVRIIATDNWSVAPALFFADKYYVTKKIEEEGYIEEVFEICEKEDINVIATLIDPEIMLLAKYRDEFIKRGILPLIPTEKTAKLCFDKYEMYKYLKENNIPTAKTYRNKEELYKGIERKEVEFPIFIKPISGSGSVGAGKIESKEELEEAIRRNKHEYIIQEYIPKKDVDVDVYIDTISREVISIFAKKKIELRIGGTSKSVSFKDEGLLSLLKKC